MPSLEYITRRLARSLKRAWQVYLFFAFVWVADIATIVYAPNFLHGMGGAGLLLAYLYVPFFIPGLLVVCWMDGKRDGIT